MPKHGPASLSDRINRIEGQIKGIKSMLNDEKTSRDVVVQVQAVISALDALRLELIKKEIKQSLLSNLDEALKLVK